MLIQEAPIDQVMCRLRAGDSAAAHLIFYRFVHRLTALANQQFDTRLRAKTDPEDVVQSVYRSFFLRDGRSPFDLPDWESLWALLAAITVRKCIDKRTFWLASRRDVGREQSMRHEDDDASWWQALDRGPTPLQASVLADVLAVVLGHLPSKHRGVAELCLQGHTAPEVAAQCDCSERTVARVVARLKERLEAIYAVERTA